MCRYGSFKESDRGRRKVVESGLEECAPESAGRALEAQPVSAGQLQGVARVVDHERVHRREKLTELVFYKQSEFIYRYLPFVMSLL